VLRMKGTSSIVKDTALSARLKGTEKKTHKTQKTPNPKHQQKTPKEQKKKNPQTPKTQKKNKKQKKKKAQKNTKPKNNKTQKKKKKKKKKKNPKKNHKPQKKKKKKKNPPKTPLEGKGKIGAGRRPSFHPRKGGGVPRGIRPEARGTGRAREKGKVRRGFPGRGLPEEEEEDFPEEKREGAKHPDRLAGKN